MPAGGMIPLFAQERISAIVFLAQLLFNASELGSVSEPSLIALAFDASTMEVTIRKEITTFESCGYSFLQPRRPFYYIYRIFALRSTLALTNSSSRNPPAQLFHLQNLRQGGPINHEMA